MSVLKYSDIRPDLSTVQSEKYQRESISNPVDAYDTDEDDLIENGYSPSQLSGSSKKKFLKMEKKLSPKERKNAFKRAKLLHKLYQLGVSRGPWIPHDFGFSIFYHNKDVGGYDEYNGVQFWNPNWDVDDIHSPQTVEWVDTIPMKIQKLMKTVW